MHNLQVYDEYSNAYNELQTWLFEWLCILVIIVKDEVGQGLCSFCALQPLQTPPYYTYYALTVIFMITLLFLLRFDSKELISVAKTWL